jgi:simple sugar transport system permease protein
MTQPGAFRISSRSDLARRALVAPVLAVGVVALLSAAVGAPPAAAVRSLLAEAAGSPFAWTGTLLHAAPILLTGLALAWAFRAGLFNIGAEGQLLWGALAAAWAGSALRLPALLHVPAALAAGAAAGALWAWPAAMLKTRRGVPEVVTTLLLSFVAVHFTTFVANGPLHDPARQGARTPDVRLSAQLPAVPGTRLHAGLLLAPGAALLLGLVLARTRFGFRLRVVGRTPEAARAAGIPVERFWTVALLQSGALAGLAGAVEVLGVHRYFLAGFSPGYGYEGIAVAILGGSSPAGVVVAALFLGGLANGAVGMAVDLDLSSEVGRSMVAVVQALVVLAVAVRRWPWGSRAPRNPRVGGQRSMPARRRAS